MHDGDQVIAEYEGASLKRRYVYGTYVDEPLALLAQSGTLYYHQNRVYSVMALTNSSGQVAERYGYTPYGKPRVVSPGGTTLSASAVGNQVGFTGRYHDAETGLTYFRARYMDPELGRFISRDPIAYQDFRLARRSGDAHGRKDLAARGAFAKWLADKVGREVEAAVIATRPLDSSIVHLQLYAYVSGDPANRVDSSGLYADVTVNGSQVTITIPIDFAGPGATDATVNNFKTAIEETWSGQFGDYTVTTKVVPGSQNQVEIPSGDGRAVTYNGTLGVWPEARPPGTIAHEAGHLLGLPDTYNDRSEDSVMNRTGSLPTADDIAKILKGNAQVSPKCGP